jgi:hypothetical protein
MFFLLPRIQNILPIFLIGGEFLKLRDRASKQRSPSQNSQLLEETRM